MRDTPHQDYGAPIHTQLLAQANVSTHTRLQVLSNAQRQLGSLQGAQYKA